MTTKLPASTRKSNGAKRPSNRIQDGSYGFCERCEELIPAKRLDALPWARLCVTCQSGTEAEARQGEVELHSAA